MPTHPPHFSGLSQFDAMALLRRNTIGRIAFSFRDRVDVEPISYVLEGDWIYGRTSPGTKLTTIAHARWVAFELDEIEDQFNWCSVVVHGTMYRLDADAPARGGGNEYSHALEVVRTIDPNAMTPTDLAPHRTEFFRIYIEKLVGRAASDH